LTIQHKVVGESMQMTVCQLGPEQSVYCEHGLANALAKRIGGDDRRGLTGGLLGGGND